MAWTQAGVSALRYYGWLDVETVGKGRAARTTFYLLPGDEADGLPDELDGFDDWDLLDAAA